VSNRPMTPCLDKYTTGKPILLTVYPCPIVTGMDTDTTQIPAVAVPRQPALSKRQFRLQFKARIVNLCEPFGAVVAQIARDHDLGSSMVKGWVREHHMRGLSKGFVPVELTVAVSFKF